MIIAVTALGVIVALLAFLVTGLLRSHAEILSRLETIDQASSEQRGAHRWRPPSERVATEVGPTAIPGVVDETLFDRIEGVDLDLQPQTLSLNRERPTVLAFLSSGCLTCAGFFAEFGELDLERLTPALDLYVVTKDREEENLTRLRDLAPDTVVTVMSSQAWAELQVPGSPYFVLIDGETHQLLGAGSANSWTQVRSLVEDALGERAFAAGLAAGSETFGRPDRERDELAAAGIVPDHPSLYAGFHGERAAP